ncbi:sugar O-acetyltransferase [Dysgonomonas sp. Marseille-P4677]|uniref:sugar O-acetyltransferase n=1 Tax=Dysgonomonas sp. Marseille-P4677 TaxID=2364790 RepID=UPI0019131150|nr:sugar O-acetyltransferase [Dysgonomonas sp. Marseille-P4677]MBK5719532.1 sugar O-acetyltransferase [Dysgonomonas sp. Marseille-P4677]
MDIFEKMKQGELILETDPDYPKLYEALLRGMRITGQLNASFHTPEQTRNIISELTGQQLDETIWIVPPFYSDFGQFIRFGKKVFVNSGCIFMDRGGITLEDGVFVGPNVNIITENHAEQPELRHNVYTKPILIKQNAWIGAAAVILPGVTIGKNAIVAAGAIVTKDVPDNTIVGGNPAKIIRKIKME